MDLGIVLVSYNTRQLTLDCLASVYAACAAAGLSAGVWVVDNASTDKSVAAIRERFPQATLIASPENLGFARGTNLGIERIRALERPPRHLLLLNPDTLVNAEALSELMAYLNDHPSVGVAGPQLRYGDGRFQHSAFRFPTLWMAFFDFWTINHRLVNSRLNGRYPRRLYDRGSPFDIDHPLGAALMIRWETLHQVGVLDEEFFMYCEEIDWCLRIRRAGWRIVCVPRAIIIHLEGQSTRQFRDRMFVALWRSRYRLFAKHYSRLYGWLVRMIVRAGLRREARRVSACAERGELTAEEAQGRLAAYRQVMEL
ncbi:MAG: glycosyltransferase family 2 protein [Anaerolineae bacterium]|nr:glycosyltransferase family 2 protein [Anaerolineae bacterium]